MVNYKYMKKHAKKRYFKKGKGKFKNFKYGKLVRDLNYIKQSLNTERKMCDSIINIEPYLNIPSLVALNNPSVQGNQIDQRVGAKVRFTHISAKLRFQHFNFGDRQSSTHIKLYIIWLKNGDMEPDFGVDDIINRDSNGYYSPLSYFNKVRYGSWIATNKVACNIFDTIPVSQSALGLASDPDGANTGDALARLPQTKSYYRTFNKKINVPTEYQNKYNVSADETEITRYKPYIFAVSDCAGNGTFPSGTDQPTGMDNDCVKITGTVRLTYVDN